MTQYEKITHPDNSESIKRINEDNSISYIPINESNSDYQAYLNTLASELSNPSTPQAGE